MTRELERRFRQSAPLRRTAIPWEFLILSMIASGSIVDGFSTTKSPLSSDPALKHTGMSAQSVPTLRAHFGKRHWPSRADTICYAVIDNKEKRKGGKARFSGLEDSGGFTNVLDYVLSLISSDVGSIVLGLIGLLVCLGHRFAAMDALSTETMGQETRSDLLAVFAAGAVLLNGVSKLDVTSALAESVRLDGITLREPTFNNALTKQNDVAWALESVLAATPAKSAILLANDKQVWAITAAAGVVPSDPAWRQSLSIHATPILDRFRTDTSKETYLPTLQALPGRVEFTSTCLPPNTQEALLLPVRMDDDGVSVLILGSDTAKSFTPRDVAWCQVLAARIGTFLES